MKFIVFLFATFFVQCCKCQYEYDFLPKNVKPIRYNLTIEPKLKETNYTNYHGSLSIEIEILEDTNNVTLHAKNLTITHSSITICDSNNNQKNIISVSYDDIRSFFIITTSDYMKNGEKWKVNIGFFSGLLTQPKDGYFFAKYKDTSNEDKYLTVTELEPMYARQVFPCFDEPALKATFIVNLIRPNTSTSASNTQIDTSTDLGDGRFQDTFQETKPMSTYLIAFVISEFKYTEVNDRVRILTRPEFISSADYMLTESPKLLKAMEEYTGLPYALDKIDLVAIPDDYFLDGAMENWGLVVYAEKYLLCTNRSRLFDLQKCTTFTAHELAHQWFGNLATPKTWSYMWLSEGFSSFFQYYLADKVEPSWRLMEQYVVEEYIKALENDIAPNTQPINFIFTDRDSFPSPYTYYSKASSVIRMTQQVLSEEIFQNGLKIYLKQNEFNSTVPKNLYDAFDEALKQANASSLTCDTTIADFLEHWATKIGHPIVTATRDYETGTVKFTQRTLRLDGETDDNFWYIPLTYMTNRNITNHFCLSNTSGSINLSNDLDDWLLVNIDQTGFYRVNYDETNWKRLTKFLRTDKFALIPPVNRAQLIIDSMFFARHGFLNSDLAFNLSTYLLQETDYIPIRTFLIQLALIPIELRDDDDFKHYIRKLLQVAYKHLGLEEKFNDTHLDKLNRAEILDWLCRSEHADCQEMGLNIIRSQKFNVLPPNLQFQILCGGIQIANLTEWELMLKKYYSTSELHEKSNYILALTCTKELKTITRLLDTLFNFDLPITPNDRIKALLYIQKFTEIGLATTLDYFVNYKHEHYERYKTVFGYNNELVSVPNRRLHQLKAIKNSGRLGQIPVSFHLSSVEREKFFFNFFAEIKKLKSI